MVQAIGRQNIKDLKGDNQQPDQTAACNCRGGLGACPVQGKCRSDCVVYRATVTETISGKKETYTGMTSREFKERWQEHKYDVKHQSSKKTTRLSTHTWALKDQAKNFDIDWEIIEKSSPHNPITKKCMLCLKEKFYIMYDSTGSTLNKRQEVFNTCRHRKKKLLENFNSWQN